jgi:hypothetical protein
MRLVPWISIALAVVVVLSPLGREVFHGLTSGEALSRSLSSLLGMIAVAVLTVMSVIEVGIRVWMRRRRTVAGRQTP